MVTRGRKEQENVGQEYKVTINRMNAFRNLMYLRMTTVYDIVLYTGNLLRENRSQVLTPHTHTQMVTMWRNGYIN